MGIRGFKKEDGGIKNERIRDEYEGSRDIENARIMNDYKVMLGWGWRCKGNWEWEDQGWEWCNVGMKMKV